MEGDQEIESVNMAEHVPLSSTRLNDVRAKSREGESFRVLSRVTQEGWPRKEVPPEALPYFNVGDELSAQNSLIFRDGQ
mgnify:CR=1 FL=1